MKNFSCILITGANVGLGYECARQLALLKSNNVQKVILGCRNPDKAKDAKKALETTTGKNIFEILIIDVSNPSSVRKAVEQLQHPIDGLILNAGGFGGKDPAAMTKFGAPATVAVNLLGHALLVDLLLTQKKLSGSVIFSGSESARGMPAFGFMKPSLKSGSVEEFTSLINGSGYRKKTTPAMYGTTKLISALWMSSMARREPSVRFVTISPGLTKGTSVSSDLSAFMQFVTQQLFYPTLTLFNKVHSLEVGATRYVDALMNDKEYASGAFYASRKGATGQIADLQVLHANPFANTSFQDNANEAVQSFLTLATK